MQPVWCLVTGLGSWVMRQGNTITITGNCAYGAQPKRIAKTAGCDITTGKKIFDAYWESAQPLAGLRDRLTQFWETRGEKKRILGVDGSWIYTRSKSALVNSLFQSAGVACAKLTAVLADIELRKRGLTVDFWTEDWKNKVYCQSLICYHV